MFSRFPLILALLAACTPDTGIKVYNSTPEANIGSHGDGDVVDAGATVQLWGTVSDDNDDADVLSATWYDGASAICPSLPPDVEGRTSCDVVLDEGEHTLVLEVLDPDNASGTARITLTATAPVVENTAPSCGITSPEDGRSVLPGETLSFTGVVADGESDAPELGVLWSSDLDGVLDETAADAEGNIGFSTSTLTYGAHSISLLVSDDEGARCEDGITVNVGQAPTALIDAPADGARFGEGETIPFLATVDSQVTAAEDLDLVWSSDLDGELDTSAADPDGLAGFSTDRLSPGSHTITLEVMDDAGLTGQDHIELVINGQPSAPGVSITPDPASPNEDLTAHIDVVSADPEGATVSYTYAWTRDGAATGLTDATVDADETEDGETWTVTVTPNDGEIDGRSGTASVTIGNSAPVLSDVSLSPDPAYEGDTLACTPGSASDADGDTISYSYNWSVNGGTIAASGTTLSSSSFDKADDVKCTVTPTDGMTSGTAVGSNTVTVENTAPAVSSVAISPTNPSVGDTLTCGYSFSDADGDSDRSTVAWTINGAAAGSGATLPTAFVGGDTIVCTVTPYDGDDTGTAASASVTIGNTAPVLSSVALGPTTAYEGDTLTCTPGSATDADGDTVSYGYAWTISGVVSPRTSSTLSSTYFAKDDTVVCTVTPTDGSSTGTPVESNMVTISNTAPEVTGVSISPSSPVASSTLSCGWTFSDADGDSDASTVVWKVNGSAVSTGTTLSGVFAGGDSVQCVVTPDDGEDVGSSASKSVTIGNTAPSLASVSLTPTTAYEGDTLSCTPGTATDVDGDAVSYSYDWVVNGSSIGRTSTTLSSTYFSKGDAVKCSVTPGDGTTSGAAVLSNTVTVSNSTPTVSSVAISPTTATASTALSCTYSFSDADSDADASTIAWKINGVSAGSGASLSGGYGGGDVVSCTVTPSDGAATGTASSASLTISNSAPSLASVSLTPTTAYEGDTMTCTPGTATDVDGDTVSYTYSWTVDGASPGVSSATLSSSYFIKNNVVRCAVAPNDGTTSGTTVASNTVTISNSAPVLSSVSISPSTAYTSDTLSVTASSSDVDGDAVTYTYVWQVDGTSVGTGSTLSGVSSFGKDDVVTVTVTPTDGTSSGTAMTASRTISNTAPGAPSVAIDPEPYADGGDDDLLCYVETDATDADGDTLTYAVSWEVDGLPYPASFGGATGPDTTEWTDDTVPAADSDLGTDWVCTVTSDDGDTEGGSATASIEALVFYEVGYSTSSSGPGSAGASYLLGPSITVSTATTLYGIGGYLGTAGNTGRFALYTSSAGVPGTLVAYTDTFTTALGANEISLATPVALPAGTYWVMGVYSATTYIYYGASSTATIKYKAASYSSTPSSSFGTASSYTGYPPSLYLVVAD